MEGARLPKITVEVDAVGACSEERHGATVETEHHWGTPARRDVEGLVARFRDPLFDDQRIHHGVDGAADRRNIAALDKAHPVVGDREDIGKPPQRCGIVTPQQPYAVLSGKKRHHAPGIVVVAGDDMVAERHDSAELRSAGCAEPLRGQHDLDIGDLAQTGGDIVHQIAP